MANYGDDIPLSLGSEQAPLGNHDAVLVDVVDRGPGNYGGRPTGPRAGLERFANARHTHSDAGTNP
jgi:hypothetical protein